MLRTLLMAMIILAGCAGTSRLSYLELGMSKDSAAKVMGGRGTSRGAQIDLKGQSTEVWEYSLQPFTSRSETYLLYFYNGKLAQWGRPGDWKEYDTSIHVKTDSDVKVKTEP